MLLSLLTSISLISGLSAGSHNVNPVDSFPLPVVPAALTSPVERAEYVVSHFFDGVILPDGPSLGLETSVANFTTVAPLASESARKQAAETLFSCATDTEKREAVRTVIEQYLFSPDSPYLNLDLFTLFLEADQPSMRRDGLLKLSSLNRTGSSANDISIAESDGQTVSLKSLAADAPATLMVFFDPECEHCIELTSAMAADQQISKAVKEGQLTIVAIYPGGELPEVPTFFPEEWITGTDSNGMIEENDLFYIPSFPEAYLLNGENLTVKARGLRTPEAIRAALDF